MAEPKENQTSVRAGGGDVQVDIERLGLRGCDPSKTYLDDDRYIWTWIGAKWDIAKDRDNGFHVYRKANWILRVGTLDLALAIVDDDEGSWVTTGHSGANPDAPSDRLGAKAD